jgi:hypothetical protein
MGTIFSTTPPRRLRLGRPAEATSAVLGRRGLAMCVTIQVYGRLAREDQEALAQALRQEFASLPDRAGEAESVSLTFCETFVPGSHEPTHRPCDARICILDEKTNREKNARFLQTLMNRSPLVPLVFQEREDRSWPQLCKKVRRAIETSWWSIVRPIELPVMIVDREQRIIKANHAALGLFGQDLVGRPYSEAVEGRPHSTGLPSGHPIRDALGSDDGGVRPRGISGYHDVVSDSGQVFRRALLVCFPLLIDLDLKITSVVVFYVDLMIRFDRINEAVQAFARADSVERLQQTIVEQIGKMGYERARLYEYDSAGHRLLGRASIGFDQPVKAERFRTVIFNINENPESHNTITKGYPALFIYNDASTKDPESDLVHYCDRRGDSEKLDKTLVNRWVDIPLLIPEVDDRGRHGIRIWGKMSVDDGKNSDRLSPRDVADLTVLAAIAGGAMGEKIRAHRDEELLNTYEEYTRHLDSEEWRGLDVPVMSRVIVWLLELYRKLFGLDLALYREFRPEDRTLVYRKGMVSPATEYPLERTKIPDEVKVVDFPSYAMFDASNVDDEGCVRATAEVKYYCHDRADEAIRKMLAVKHQLSDEEVRYLNWIRSEIGVPIVVRNKVREVLVGLSSRPHLFPADRNIVLRRFTSVAHLWFQLGELHDARTTAIKILGDSLKAWSLIQDVDDQSLYAGLAAILTAGCGLGWHRAMIFRNLDDSMTAAELVYAVGGMGEDSHGRHQMKIESAERDLEALVRKRIDDPRPRGFDPEINQCRGDSLYETYVERYVEDPEHRPRASYAEGGSRLREILEPQARGKGRPPFLKLHRDDELIQSANARYPGLFAARMTYFFPLYSVDAEHPGPLGFIALDNVYRPNPLEETHLSLTMAIVELVRDTVAARLRYRLFTGMLGALPLMRHGPQVMGNFASFEVALQDLLDNLADPSAPAQDVPGLIAEVRTKLEALRAPSITSPAPSSSSRTGATRAETPRRSPT